MKIRDNNPSKPFEEELESLREKIAHIQSFVQRREKDSLLNAKKDLVPLKNQEKIFSFLDEGPLGMAFIDSAGRVVKANKTFREYSGYTEKETASLEIQALFKNDPSCLQFINQTIDGSLKVSRTESQIFRKNGEYF